MKKTVKNEGAGWSKVSEYGYAGEGGGNRAFDRNEAYLLREEDRTSERGGSVITEASYGYDLYGNTITIQNTENRADGNASPVLELKAEISYKAPDPVNYLAGLPETIQVYSGGKQIRERRGEYNAYGALKRLTEEAGIAPEGKEPLAVVHTISWDAYGNIAEVSDSGGSYTRFEYAYGYQYPSIITVGGPNAGPYTSSTDWNPIFGVKIQEVDENG
jgi:YD repeat-containing protein